jgi:hypothetical protein
MKPPEVHEKKGSWLLIASGSKETSSAYNMLLCIQQSGLV